MILIIFLFEIFFQLFLLSIHTRVCLWDWSLKCSTNDVPESQRAHPKSSAEFWFYKYSMEGDIQGVRV